MGFRVEQPPGWVELEDNFPPSLIELRAPMGNRTGVGIYQLPYNNSLSEFTKNYTSFLNQTYQVLSLNMTSLSEMPAYQSVYHDSSKGTNVLSVWTLKDGDIFIITYLAYSDQFDDYLPDAINFVKSFQFNR
jgi:hypothetical protein